VTSHLLPTYARVHLAFERGEGVWLTSTDGERYLDFTSGVAVNALGHAHPHLVAALTAQAQKLWHVSNLYEVPEAEHVAQRLCDACFADVVFFCNSGAEAMECTIKTARKYHSANGVPERHRIITFEGAFHGRTLATLAAEPAMALTPGPSGLEALSAIIADAPPHLNAGGWLLLEHGSTQAADVASLLKRRGFEFIRTVQDLAGRARVTVGRVHTQH